MMFLFPIIALMACISFGVGLGGAETGIIVALLCIMEVSLSFDNAVVNAAVLNGMPVKWQKRFLAWGMPIAVFGMRLLFPVLIVSLSSGLGLMAVGNMALNNPAEYSSHVIAAHEQIAAFGGMFLLMVFLNFITTTDKTHWLWIEKHLSKLSRLRAAETFLAVMVVCFAIPQNALVAGLMGILTYTAIQEFNALCVFGIRAGLAGLLYLEILDASFSLDGVIGAFAISNNIFVIMMGLGVGAFFIRSLTLYMVKGKVLEEYEYLENGANWGIGSLAVIMLTTLYVPVPEVLTGLISVGFIVMSFLSSLSLKRCEAI